MHFGRLLVPIAAAAGLTALVLVATAPAGAAPPRHPAASPRAQLSIAMHTNPVEFVPGAGLTGSILHSQNWAGYVALPKSKAGRFRAISAQFRVPRVNCTKTPHTISVHWVGLDGFSLSASHPNKTVEQDGVLAQCAGAKGRTAQYAAWWENFPANPIRVAFRIHPGNLIVSSVIHKTKPGAHHNQYNLIVRDLTTHKRLNVWKKCGAKSCQDNTAEIISEAPTGKAGILPLSDYRTIKYAKIRITNLRAKVGGISSSMWKHDKIVQFDTAGHLLAMPTVLFGHGGRGFNVTWHRRA
ncbi:MAG TPA: G1 family glutamic endopeptidase [Streptosporangiaceae bacterium]|jgi:hypothetical protein